MLVLTRLLLFALIFNELPFHLAAKSNFLPVSSLCRGLPNDLYPDPSSCHKFLHCHQNGQTASKKCPSNTMFNPVSKMCDFPRNVKCIVPIVFIVVHGCPEPSKPRGLTVTKKNSTAFLLKWRSPIRYSKPLLRYVIGYQRQTTGPSNQSQVVVQPDVHSYTFSGLLPASNYLIEIQAVNNAGYSRKALLRVNTLLEVPQEPANLSASPLGPTAISLKWKEPKLSNDHILSYTVTYGVAGLKIGQNSFHLHGYAHTAVLTNLMPGVEYEVKVQALSFGGFGKPGVITVRTPSGDFCSPGRYSQTGMKPCSRCSYGRYQPRIGKTRCIKCPRGTITLIEGAASIKDCVKVTID